MTWEHVRCAGTCNNGGTTSACYPSHAFIAAVPCVACAADFSFTGTAGSSHYVTFDFAVPTHGYPRVTVTGATSGEARA